MSVKFEWNKTKSIQNFKKHGISFDEASSVFTSEPVRIFNDHQHSDLDVNRMIAIGYSYTQKLLIVVHCYFEDKDTIRIISARKTTKYERNFFENNWST